MIARGCRFWLAGVLGLLLPSMAQAQPANLQLWGNVTLDWVKSDRLTYELDFEPKVLVYAPEGEPAWRSLDVTPNVEYAAKGWLDLVAEVATGYTKQNDDVNTLEVTPRVGVRFHFLSRNLPAAHFLEQAPRRRIVVRDLVRVESRQFFYTGSGSGTSSSVRFRNRLEFLVPLNKERMSDDGARYFLADWEWFIPLDEPDERFASKQRVRTGIGYRRSFAWRFEVLYIWTRSRDTIDEGFSIRQQHQHPAQAAVLTAIAFASASLAAGIERPNSQMEIANDVRREDLTPCVADSGRSARGPDYAELWRWNLPSIS